MQQIQAIVLLSLAILGLTALMSRQRRHRAPIAVRDPSLAGQSEHHATGTMRACVALTSLLALLKTAEAAQTSSLALMLGSLMVPLCAWLNAYAWQFHATLSGSDLTLMSPAFREVRFDLTRLVDVRDDAHAAYRLRFQGGKTAWILRYVSGHGTLRRALYEARPYY